MSSVKKRLRKKETLKEQGFYHSMAWRRLRVQALERDHYLCQNCLKKQRITRATEVHHVKPVEEYPELALVLDNLESLCWDCHEETKHQRGSGTPPGVRVIDMAANSDSASEVGMRDRRS